MGKTLLLAAVLLVGGGCYSYVPADIVTVPIGEGVRVGPYSLFDEIIGTYGFFDLVFLQVTDRESASMGGPAA